MSGTKRYQLHVKVGERWKWQCDIEAESHAVAFGRAMMGLKPEHFQLPIRLEQVAEKKRKNPGPGKGPGAGSRIRRR